MKRHEDIDLEKLALAIRTMKPRQKFYDTLQRELEALGRWKVKGRGAPEKGYVGMRKALDRTGSP